MRKECSDIELVELFVLDDAEAFKMIYNRYSKQMFLFAINILNKKEVCEDVVQNIFTDLWQKRKEKTINDLRPYLFQAVKYQVFKYLRDKKFTTQQLDRLIIVDTSINISKDIELKQLMEKIDIHVSKLPKRCQEIFLLSRYQYKSNGEISTELGISVQAVKNQISKAIHFLRENLREEELI